MRTVISDTSPLFYLARLGKLDALWQTYGRVIVPQTVWLELQACNKSHSATAALLAASLAEGWIDVHDDIASQLPIAVAGLDAGEARAIAMALDLEADYLIIDEASGRSVARKMGLSVVGTGGILLEAKLRGLLPSLRTELDKLGQMGFRLGNDVVKHLLQSANEWP